MQFSISITTLIRVACVRTPLGIIKFYIIKVNTLFLLCLGDIDRLGIYFNNTTNRLYANK